jgi:hypothetical protein
MLAPAVARRGLVALMNVVPASAAARFDVDAEGAELELLPGGLRLVTETGAVPIVEFTDAEVVEEARSLLPGHGFEALSDRHWLLRGAA